MTELEKWRKRCDKAFIAAVQEWARHIEPNSLSEEEYKAAIERIAMQVVMDNPSPGWTRH